MVIIASMVMSEMRAGLTRAIREEAERRSAELQGLPDYDGLAEFFRRQTVLESTGLGPELGKFMRRPSVPPLRPTFRGKLLAFVGRLITPFLWRLLRVLGSPNPFEAVYEMALCQMEWQLAAEGRIAEELAAIRARLDALEAALKERSQAS